MSIPIKGEDLRLVQELRRLQAALKRNGEERDTIDRERETIMADIQETKRLLAVFHGHDALAGACRL